MAQVKERGGAWEERKEEVSFLPLLLPPLSFFGSCFMRVKTETPFHGLFLLRNQTETLATQASLMGYIGMCRCEGYGFQAVYAGIGNINQRVWV